MNQEELNKVLELHKMWLNCEKGGVRAILSGTNLCDAILSGANLYGANLSGANLSGADLSGADLYGADLSGADLYGAVLSGADLYGANLSGAILSDADLRGAILSGANLYGANLSGAKNIYIFNAYNTSKRTVYCVRNGDTFMCQAGCFWGSLDELETKVKEEHNSKVYLGNIAIMREILKDSE